jgi:1-aminocyclopropane-1-carboxylate deaminase/D-cysteine desulfhydrase-like pyridoxal-dependent ACC family enzyme
MKTYDESFLSQLPRITLCAYDTPVQRMLRLEEHTGIRNLYVKRDDLNGVGPGGNKVRALEYLFGEAKASGSDTIIVSGQENSNLCTITAAAASRVGFKCAIVHNNRKPDTFKGNALLNEIMEADRIFIGEKSEEERNDFVSELAKRYRNEGKKPFVIKNGATTPRGAVGYSHIIYELLRKGAYPFTDIFVPGGNGGLAAGVILGNFLCGNPYHIHVITVEHTLENLHAILLCLLKEISSILGIKNNIYSINNITIHDKYRGEGWGIPTSESVHMIYKLANLEGIFLEKVYTSKTLYGMIDLLARNIVKAESSCFIHSGGFGALFAQFE